VLGILVSVKTAGVVGRAWVCFLLVRRRRLFLGGGGLRGGLDFQLGGVGLTFCGRKS